LDEAAALGLGLKGKANQDGGYLPRLTTRDAIGEGRIANEEAWVWSDSCVGKCAAFSSEETVRRLNQLGSRSDNNREERQSA
jgi:hypothetical protein